MKMGLDISQKSLILCGFADFEGRIGGRLVAKIKRWASLLLTLCFLCVLFYYSFQ